MHHRWISPDDVMDSIPVEKSSDPNKTEKGTNSGRKQTKAIRGET
jgi:hypothetical protein